MTNAEFILKYRGYAKRRSRAWEHTRQVCYTIAQANSIERLPPINVWWQLDTDEGESLDLTEEDMSNSWEAAISKEGDGKRVKSKD